MRGGYARGLTPDEDVTFLLTVMSQNRNTANASRHWLVTENTTCGTKRDVRGNTESICVMFLPLWLIAGFGSIDKVRTMLGIALMGHSMRQSYKYFTSFHFQCHRQSFVDCCAHSNSAKLCYSGRFFLNQDHRHTFIFPTDALSFSVIGYFNQKFG